jgi:probable LLM family oxidoreductase
MEFGISSFGDLRQSIDGSVSLDPQTRLQNLIEEIELADQVGIDVVGLGEHHRPDFAISAPEAVLAFAAARTRNIRLSSAVTVLSSADPVRVYQNFSTIDLLSNGRAEIWAGRGSFIESFPLFGQDLDNYDALFAEHLELLLNIRENEIVRSEGRLRASIDGRGVYPRSLQDPLPVWIAVGGSPQSAQRAGLLGLPMILAIIGGNWRRFEFFTRLYRESTVAAGHDQASTPLAINALGYIADNSQDAIEAYFPAYLNSMSTIARERGWGRLDRSTYDPTVTFEGAFYVGSPQQITEKILAAHEVFGHDRFVLQIGTATIPHKDVLHAIELFGTEVIPAVNAALKQPEPARLPPPTPISTV